MTTIMEYAAQFRDARLTWDGLDARHLAAIQLGGAKPGDREPAKDAPSEAMDAAQQGIIDTPATSLEEALCQLWMVPYCAENIESDDAFLDKVDRLIYSAVEVLERHTGVIRETYRFDSFMRRDFDPRDHRRGKGGAS